MKELLKNLSLSLLSIVFLFLLLNTIASFTITSVSRVNFTPVPDSIRMRPTIPEVPFLLRPNSETIHYFGSDPRGYFDDGATLTYRTNSLGFRGPETSLKKPTGTFRIVGLGDSFTFGTGVRQEDTFLAVLEKTLNATRGHISFEVINFGVMGFNTTHEVSLLQHIGVTYDPDAVVICFFLNDADGCGTHEIFNAATKQDIPFWRRHSRLLDYIATRFERRLAVRSLVESYHNSFRDDSIGWISAQRALKKAKAISKQHGFHLVLMIFPVLWNLSESYPFVDIHDTIVSFSERSLIPVLDLLPAFNGFDGPELWVHPNNQHPNERAHKIAAQALHRFIREN
jgi:hypothetical protein